MKKYNRVPVDIISVSKRFSLFFPDALKVVFCTDDKFGRTYIRSALVPASSIYCSSDLFGKDDEFVLIRHNFIRGFIVNDLTFDKYFCSVYAKNSVDPMKNVFKAIWTR